VAELGPLLTLPGAYQKAEAEQAEPWKVWDEANSSERLAEEFDAAQFSEAGDAAGTYAQEDSDGLSEGIYASPHAVMVRTPAGQLFRVMIQVDWDPVPFCKGIEEVSRG
jgi:hypothetical protein